MDVFDIKRIIKKILKMVIPYGLFYFYKKKKEKKESKKDRLFQVEIHITEHCNLKCRSCFHFSCIAEKEFLSTELFERDIRRMSQLSSRLSVIKLVGGEPLLHTNICDFIKITKNYYPNTLIQITTNGILLDKQNDEFWNTCRENNVLISVSTYPIKLEIEKIEKIARDKKVYLVYDQDREKIYNQEHIERKYMLKWHIDVNGKQNFCKSYSNCDFKMGGCVTLRDGKIYNCCIPAHIKYFNKKFVKKLEITQDDYIDIYSIDSIQKIIEFLGKPFPFCRYCMPMKVRPVEWGITKNDISEWT